MILTLAISSCVLLAMVSIDASASAFGGRDSNAVRTDVVLTLASKFSNSQFSGLVKRWTTVSTVATPTAPPATITTIATGGAGGGGGTPTVTTTAAPTTATTAAPQAQQSISVIAAQGVAAKGPGPSGVGSFGSTTGTRPKFADVYLWDSLGWNFVDDLGYQFSSWEGSGYTMVVGVPIIPTDSSGNPEGTLAAGAAGDYNSYYVKLANSLVSMGFGGAYLRLGWEFNGNWMPWKVATSTDAANFVAYWQNIATAMRSVSGANFKFVWNPNWQGSYGSAYSPSEAYPGNAYVDYIGLDVYDETWITTCGLRFNNRSTPRESDCVWANETRPALNGWASFAASEGKPLVLCEWGLVNESDGHGLGDDATFINNIAAWIRGNNVALEIYFNVDKTPGHYAVTDGNFPNSLASFRTDFGRPRHRTTRAEHSDLIH